MSRISCQKGPTRHAYAWQIGPFWQDTLDVRCNQKELLAKQWVPQQFNLLSSISWLTLLKVFFRLTNKHAISIVNIVNIFVGKLNQSLGLLSAVCKIHMCKQVQSCYFLIVRSCLQGISSIHSLVIFLKSCFYQRFGPILILIIKYPA